MGGIELHLRDLALALKRQGHDAEIITTTPGPETIEGVRVRRVASLRLPVVGMAASPLVRARVQHVLERVSFDVVHAHASVFSPVAYSGMRAGVALGLPTVVTFHSMLHRSARVLAAADALIGWSRNVVISAVSSVVASQLAARMPDVDIAILGNGVDSRFWASSGPHSTGRVHFVSAMRLTRKKRGLELIRAFATAHQFVAGTPELTMTIAGDGPDREAMHRLAAELGIGARVTLPGHLDRDQLRSLYRDADVFVLPSERESFGIAALEARAAGLPVIAMLATGARDFMVPGQNGMLARDHAELSRFIARMALEPATRALMRVNNRRPPIDHDWSAIVAAHLAIYGVATARRDSPVNASQT